MTERLVEGRGLALLALLVALPLAAASATAPLESLALTAALAVMALVLFNGYGLLLVVVLCFPWEGMLHYPSETLSAPKLLGALLMVAYVLQALVRSERLRYAGNLGAIAVFVTIMLVVLIVCPMPSEAVNKALRYVLFAAFAIVFVQLARERWQIERVVLVVGASTVAAAGYGLLRFLTGAAGRAGGPIGDPNDYAYFLASMLPLVAYLATRAHGRGRVLWWIGAAIVVLATAATLSRGSLVGLGALAAWALLTRRVRLAGALSALAAIVLLSVGAVTLYGPLINERLGAKDAVASANVASRQALWSAAIRMGEDHPWAGVGPGRFGIESERYVIDDPINLTLPYVHNAYLEVFAEAGFPGLAAFLTFLAATWSLASRSHRRAEQEDDRGLAALSSAVQGGLVVAMAAAVFLSAQIISPMWLLAGLAAALALLHPPPPRLTRTA